MWFCVTGQAVSCDSKTIISFIFKLSDWLALPRQQGIYTPKENYQNYN